MLFCTEQTLVKLCHAAKTSTCCQQCMYKPDQYYAQSKSVMEEDVYLEVALLVVCGCDVQEARRRMIELGKDGKLVGYRQRSL
jgi:hypothetical protein